MTLPLVAGEDTCFLSECNEYMVHPNRQ